MTQGYQLNKTILAADGMHAIKGFLFHFERFLKVIDLSIKKILKKSKNLNSVKAKSILSLKMNAAVY